MKKEGHYKKALEIYESIMQLVKDEKHVAAITELAYGCALHYIAWTSDKKFGSHVDIHAVVPRFLRERDCDKVADIFEKLDTLRHGRWYGGKGNGETIKKILSILDEIRKWCEE